MNNETYGIQLDLITTPFKQKMKDTQLKIDELSRTIKTLQNEMKDANPGTNAFKFYSEEISKAKTELQGLRNEQNKFNNGIGGVQKSIQTGVKGLKRFALALFSIKTGFSLISRAANAYISSNQELSNKIQSSWAGLGAMFAPIIERIVSLISKAVAYINIFVKALTGVDLIAKASTKSIKSMGGAAKETSKSLAGFDTINNLDQGESSGSGASISNPFADIANVDVDTKWADKITAFGEYIRNNWKTIVAGIAAVGVAISAVSIILGGPISLTIAAIGVAIAAITALVIANWDKIKGVVLPIANWIYSYVITPIINFFKVLVQSTVSICKTIISNFKTAYNNIVSIFKPIVSFFNTLLNNVGISFKGFGTKAGELISGAFKLVVNGVLKTIENLLNTPIKAINSMISTINTLPGVSITKLSTFNLPKLATGTNYVPADMTAVIHKGEAVVPKKFNSKEYFNQGNDETNELLRTLITTLENKDTNVYMDSKKVGQSVTNYINSQSRIMGRSVV